MYFAVAAALFHALGFQSETEKTTFLELPKLLTTGPDNPEGPALPSSPYEIIKLLVNRDGRERGKGKDAAPILNNGRFVSNNIRNQRRRDGLMVSALVSGSSSLGSSPGQGHRVVTLDSQSTSLHPGV